ncbi:pentraxin-related protein PTX3 [Callorhinchus milii]|uniref:Pentraxin-related protein PTX3 n=1 Tax=Callorhinchus milii TaxID=7868 RepID=A0A4W3GAT8_CALMI|nr:pentraxin-related protein PTX3 [Callorhinchus milii]|eukprot:gi/632934898/ref/XP_007886919.1/ PREDICTED: pentraxin-related protein PTX3 [Callorhinchus milii]
MAAFAIVLWILLNLSYILTQDYGEIQYVNGVENQISVLPDGSCRCQKELSKWDKLFVMLEDSQMRENMVMQSVDEVLKVELQSMRSEMLHFVANFAGTCTNAMDSATIRITSQLDKKLTHKLEEVRRVRVQNESEVKSVCQQLLLASRDVSSRLGTLETAWQTSADAKDHQPPIEVGKTSSHYLETTLNSLTFELQQIKAELRASRARVERHTLPTGCEMAMVFPMRSKKIYASVHPSDMTLSSFTACVWVKVTEVLEKTIVFSYGTKRNPYQIQLFFDHFAVVLSVGNETSQVVAKNVVFPGQWKHICGIWSAENGNATLWVDGKLAGFALGVAENYNIPDGGILQLGQEKNGCCVGGGFDESLAFSGKLTDFNIWDTVLEEEAILSLATYDFCKARGNVVGWGVTEILPHGGAAFSYY